MAPARCSVTPKGALSHAVHTFRHPLRMNPEVHAQLWKDYEEAMARYRVSIPGTHDRYATVLSVQIAADDLESYEKNA